MNIKKMASIFIVMLGVGWTTKMLGNQVVSINEQEKVSVSIAPHELNHIAIQHDRIKAVRGLAHQYVFKEDAQTGHLYLKPLIDASEHPINLFLTTEKGKTYQLELMPNASSAQSIVLKPSFLLPIKLTRGPHFKGVSQLLHAMRRGNALEGYHIKTCEFKE